MRHGPHRIRHLGVTLASVFALPACVATNANKAVPEGCSVLDWGDADTTHAHRIMHDGSGIELVFIPPGAFEMGYKHALIGQPNDWGGTRHYRLVRHGFYLGVTEVTVAQWRRFAAASQYQTELERGESEVPGRVQAGVAQLFETIHERKDQAPHAEARWYDPLPNRPDFTLLDSHPVTQVSHTDAASFAQHYGMHLPTEVQWEYAFRAGDTRVRPDITRKTQNYWDLDAKTAYGAIRQTRIGDGYPYLAPCGSYQASPWGLHDMMGNVSEWCQDVWSNGDKYIAVDEEPQILRSRSSYAPLYHVVRGGSWTQLPPYLKFAYRDRSLGPTCDRGFRVVLNVTEVWWH